MDFETNNVRFSLQQKTRISYCDNNPRFYFNETKNVPCIIHNSTKT